MRISVFFFIVSIFFCSVVFSQIRPGIRVGGLLSVPDVTSELLESTKPQPALGWTASLFTQVPLGKKGFYVSPELGILYYAYNGNGSANVPVFGMVSVSGDANITYAQLPVHIGYKGKAGRSTFFIEAGGYTAIGLKGENNMIGVLGTMSFIGEGPVEFGRASGQVRRSDLGISAAAGVQFGDKWGIRLHVVKGLPTITSIGVASFRNRYAGLTLQYGGFFRAKG
jgi:hypothetical protein